MAEVSPEEGDYPPPPHSPSPELGKEEGMYVGQTADLGEQGLLEEAPELRGVGGASGWEQYGEPGSWEEGGRKGGKEPLTLTTHSGNPESVHQ